MKPQQHSCSIAKKGSIIGSTKDAPSKTKKDDNKHKSSKNGMKNCTWDDLISNPNTQIKKRAPTTLRKKNGLILKDMKELNLNNEYGMPDVPLPPSLEKLPNMPKKLYPSRKSATMKLNFNNDSTTYLSWWLCSASMNITKSRRNNSLILNRPNSKEVAFFEKQIYVTTLS